MRRNKRLRPDVLVTVTSQRPDKRLETSVSVGEAQVVCPQMFRERDAS